MYATFSSQQYHEMFRHCFRLYIDVVRARECDRYQLIQAHPIKRLNKTEFDALYKCLFGGLHVFAHTFYFKYTNYSLLYNWLYFLLIKIHYLNFSFVSQCPFYSKTFDFRNKIAIYCGSAQIKCIILTSFALSTIQMPSCQKQYNYRKDFVTSTRCISSDTCSFHQK